MSIFVSIASFCDEHLIFTLRSLLNNADAPQEIFVGVVDQSHVPLHAWLVEYDPDRRIRYLHVDPFHSRGVCWARHLACSLYDGEDYYLQIDSHTFFTRGWDTILLNHLQCLSLLSNKPLLSTYPPPFEFNEAGQAFRKLRESNAIYALEVIPDCMMTEENPILRLRVDHADGNQGDYARGFHVAGGFIFASGQFIQEVPYDPFLYFHGEEQSLALRAFTTGWDIFHPRHREIPLSHLYKHRDISHQGHHWRADLEALRSIKWTERRQRAMQRLCRMIDQNDLPAPYRLGEVRTLEDFCELSGIDYRRRWFEYVPPQLVKVKGSPAPVSGSRYSG